MSGLVSGSSPVARPMAHPLRGWTVAAEHGPAASIGECSCSELVIAKVDRWAFIGGSVSRLDVSGVFKGFIESYNIYHIVITIPRSKK